ncbi:hypothetical protein A2911_02215 [Candidatus Nomurabacteria bacterium RIFCSPLOWO2_01_FULL_40_15]|uniref:Aminotransferase class V domain-containing protein n=1 Tax=Candidatus Nomurabacteria bacterium RIFCSPLOWO2_01_FULL_40_15 TaxID=1801772 RepID=A0A1F6X878_9BACT|nr:MAG: hypothetical protein A2911_02215 [Candidatus Nomurabacteria bacterium RIFCSPLOWO2_01_FULL_40_15]
MPKSNKKLHKTNQKIYLDYASSVSPNASSLHELGVKTRQKLENARSRVASILYSRPLEIIFTSGGTESNNLAIQGVVLAGSKRKIPHIITTNIEHPSVLETFKVLAKRKLAQISLVGVEANGIVDPKKIKKEIKKNTILVSVMYANNEIGTIQPIKEIAKEIRHYKKQHRRNNIFFHTDAVQAGNYLPLNVEQLGVDLLSLSGSKILNAGRVGVLFKKKNVPLFSIFAGGNQETGFRPGTENVDAIVKFADALEFAQKAKEKETKRLTILRDYFIKKLPRGTLGKLGKNLVINGDLKNRLPNNVNITIPKIPSDLLVIELSARGIYASSKSACKSGDGKASHVIRAINPKVKDEDGSLRFSLGRATTKNDIDYTIKSLALILSKLGKWYN